MGIVALFVVFNSIEFEGIKNKTGLFFVTKKIIKYKKTAQKNCEFQQRLLRN